MERMGDFVRLVRLLDESRCKNSTISGRIKASAESVDLVGRCINSGNFYIDFPNEQSSEIGRQKLKDSVDDQCSFEIQIDYKKSPSEHQRVYADFEDLFNRYNPFLNGLLSEFYILEENIHYPADQSALIDKVRSVVSFGSCLSKLSMYEDSSRGVRSIVFIGYDKDKHAAPVALDISLGIDDLEGIPVNFSFSLLEKLSGGDSKDSDIHYESKVSIFNSTISEFLGGVSDRKEAFKKLIVEWSSFVEKYQKNLSIYTSGYVFGKIKHELAEKEIEVAESFAKVLSDMTTRVLSIPVSLLVVFFLRKLNDTPDYALAFFALLFLSVIIFVSILGQEKSFKRIVQAKNIYFEKVGFDSRHAGEVSDLIGEVAKGLNGNECFVGKVIFWLKFAAWLPFVAGLLYMGFKSGYFDCDWVVSVFNFARVCFFSVLDRISLS